MKKKKIEPEEIIEKMRKFCIEEDIVVYLVGGYLRDKFLKRKNKDIDFVMEQDALKIAEGFSKKYNLPIPIFYGRFGTAMIEVNDIKLEFATARKESYPEDSRKPFVEKTTIYQDLKRRDFTINSIAQNLITGEILDPFDGRGDIKRKLIKTPVDPDKTFFDDPLRILRGVRFATKFKFKIEENTLIGMKKNKDRIKIVSEERIADEIMKILECSTPSIGFKIIDEIGLLEIILPEIANLKEKRTHHPCKELFLHTLKTLDNCAKLTKNVYIRLACLLHDIGKPYTLKIENGKVSFHRHEFVGEKMSYNICRRLKISEENARFIGKLIRFHLRPHLLAKENPTDSALRRFIREVGKDMKALFILAKSDLTSRNPKKVKDALERLEKLESRIKEINRKDKLSSFKLAINGFDIMEILKIPPSKKVGIIKEHLENLVIEKQLSNRKRVLKKYIIENAEKLKNLDVIEE
ncbi:MAG: CCA tRNA nucleotidyltransferase [Candidatus Omnitrophica bacterium]|nr:CCA tRNA nucleotidyltransferase [Candidatus Omnitrophota bacterium]MCM8802027.1 CCA tRNA nucleotidyltransferase [Candidatus Omnitrophota bacterium]